jgi:hypothetical protein
LEEHYGILDPIELPLGEAAQGSGSDLERSSVLNPQPCRRGKSLKTLLLGISMGALSRLAVVCAGVFALQTCVSTGQQFVLRSQGADPRLSRLKRFFSELESPAYFLAEEFLAAADRHGLDWRLLPSISIVESGGGREFKNNNIMGWDSCQEAFPSPQAGVEIVASRLADSKFYKTKDLDHKLATYNPVPGYARRVKALMNRLSAEARPSPLVE